MCSNLLVPSSGSTFLTDILQKCFDLIGFDTHANPVSIAALGDQSMGFNTVCGKKTADVGTTPQFAHRLAHLSKRWNKAFNGAWSLGDSDLSPACVFAGSPHRHIPCALVALSSFFALFATSGCHICK